MSLPKRKTNTTQEIGQIHTSAPGKVTGEIPAETTGLATEESNEYLQLPRKKTKGGRPPKGIKRNVLMVVRLTPSEKIVIDSRARKAGITPSEWFRKAAKMAQIVPRLLPAELTWLKMLSGLANNLNQLTKLAHTVGLLTLAQQCRALFAQVEELLIKMFKDDRKEYDR